MVLFVKPRQLALGVVCLAAVSASISLFAANTASEPMLPQATVTALTKPGFFTEPGIAIDPLNPNKVTAIYQDNVHIAFSSDAGANWTDVPKAAPPEWRVSGDVSVTYDNSGHAIASFMAFNRLGTEGYWAHNAPAGGLYIRRSLDGGKTWESHARTVIEHVGDHPPPLWEDKPYIVADQSHGPHAGNLYIGWTRWTLTGSEILLSRSTDDGMSWSTPLEIDAHPGLPRDDTGANEGFWGVVGADSTFYAVWADAGHIAFTLSADGGRSFSKARDIIPTAPIMYGIADLDRANGFPQLAIDPRATPDAPHGRLYVAWADYRNGGVDVFLSTSADEGNHWTPAMRVNNDPLHNGADHFFPALAVDPVNGDVYVSFYDRRADSNDRAAMVTLARSTDHGNTFVNYAWTKHPFTMGNVFMGDYSGLAARDGHVYGVWTDHVETARTNAKPQTANRHRDNNTVVNVGTALFH